MAVLSPVAAAAADTLTVTTPTGAAIQAALDRAAGDPGIDTVRLDAGVPFVVDSSLRVPTGVTLRGATDNPADTVLRYTGQDTAVLDLTDRSDVTLHGFTVDGSSGRAGIGVLAWGASRPSNNVHVEALDIRHIGNDAPGTDPHQFGVFFGGDVFDSTVTRTAITDINPGSEWSAGIRVAHGSSRNTFTHNTVTTTGRGGILANNDAADLYIAHNTIDDTGRAGNGRDFGLGIELWEGSDRSVVEHNVVDRWLSVDSSDGVAVRHNVVHGRGGPDAFAGLEFVSSEDFVASDNVVNGGSHLGISISGSGATRHGLFLRNVVRDADTWGIQVFGEAGGVEKLYFRENLFADTQPDGNTLYGSEGDAIRLLGNVDDLVFDANTIADNAGAAFADLSAGNPDVTFVDNEVEDNGNDATPQADAPLITTASLGDASVPSDPSPGWSTDGETLTLEFAGIAEATRVLWDLGEGAPLTTNHAGLPVALLRAGLTVSAVAWDADGGSAYAEFTAERLPEPAAWLLLGAAGVCLRPVRD